MSDQKLIESTRCAKELVVSDPISVVRKTSLGSQDSQDYQGILVVSDPIFSLVYNMLLSGVFIIIGRIIIGWVPVKW